MQQGDTTSHWLYQANQTQQVYLNTQLKQLGLTPDQARVLDFIAAHPQTNQRAVSLYLSRQAASTSNLIKGLRQRGWVDQHLSPTSERERQLVLTSSGEALTMQIAAAFNALQQQVAAALTPTESQQLTQLLQKLTIQLRG